MPTDPSRCWEWNRSTTGRGYGSTTVDGKKWRVHRYVWTVLVGPIPGGMLVCHRCDNMKCVRLSHLFLGTWSDNMLDCSRKNRLGIQRHPECYSGIFGSNHPAAKLNERKVRKIRNSKVKSETLAKKYGVSKSLIRQVINRNIWKQVA
jgi:hypothetical protein